MKKYILILVMSSGLMTAIAQDSSKVIGLHRAVGKVISADEKKYYGLFPEYVDSTFANAIITRENDSSYTLHVTALDGREITRPITRKEMDSMWDTIDRRQHRVAETDYVAPRVDEEEERRRHREIWRQIGAETITNAVIITMEVILTIAFSK